MEKAWFELLAFWILKIVRSGVSTIYIYDLASKTIYRGWTRLTDRSLHQEILDGDEKGYETVDCSFSIPLQVSEGKSQTYVCQWVAPEKRKRRNIRLCGRNFRTEFAEVYDNNDSQKEDMSILLRWFWTEGRETCCSLWLRIEMTQRGQKHSGQYRKRWYRYRTCTEKDQKIDQRVCILSRRGEITTCASLTAFGGTF
jgi:hypothetical protein